MKKLSYFLLLSVSIFLIVSIAEASPMKFELVDDGGGCGGGYNHVINVSTVGSGKVTGPNIDCGCDCSESLPFGLSVTLTAIPGFNNTIGYWTNECAGSGTICQFILYDNTSIQVGFVPNDGYFNLDISKAGNGQGTVTGPNIDCGCDCIETYPSGTEVPLSATPLNPSREFFSGWSGGGCTGTGTCIVRMDQAQTVTANFELITYETSVSKIGVGEVNSLAPNSDINCGCNCIADFLKGSLVSLKATTEGYDNTEFLYWTGACTGSDDTCVFFQNDNTTAQAVFGSTLSLHDSLNVQIQGDGGTVTSNLPGINCGSGGCECNAYYLSGTRVVLTPYADEGYEFLGWNYSGCPGTGPCELFVVGGVVVNPFFDLKKYDVTYNTGGNGEGSLFIDPPGIPCTGYCTEPYLPGTDVVASADPEPYSYFVNWSGDVCNGSTNPVCEFTVPEYDIDLSGYFDYIYYSMVISQYGDGSGRVVGDGIDCPGDCFENYVAQTQHSFEATVDEFSSFGGWTGACTHTNPTCVVTVDGPKDLGAYFNGLLVMRDNFYGVEPLQALPVADWGEKDSGDDIFFHNGQFYLTITDLEIPGRGFNYRFQRSYKNQITYDGPLGHKWDFNYNMHLTQELNGDIYVLSGATRKDLYVKNLDESYASPAGFYNKLTKNPDDSFTLQDRHGLKHNFHAFDGSKIEGALESIVDRNGNTMQFSYTNGLLTTVIDTLGRNIAYSYNNSGDNIGRLKSIQDFTGRTILFTYDMQGDLVAVRSPIVIGTPNGNDFPEGKTTKYSYDLDHNLISITNPNQVAEEPQGPPVLTNTYGTSGYELDKVIQQDFGYGKFTYFYEEDPGDLPLAHNLTTVVDRAGNVTEYFHDINGSRIELKEYAGRLNPSEDRAILATLIPSVNPSFPPIPKVRSSDPDFFTTTYAYNPHGEIAQIVYPKGNCIDYDFDDENLDVYQQGNLLGVARRPYDGAPDVDSIILSYTYEPSFNFVETKTDPKGNITTYTYNPSNGDLLTIIHPDVSNPVSQIDITETFTYNSYGQLLTHTDPENNVTEFQYYTSPPSTGYLHNSIKDPGGLNLTTAYTYDTAGNIATITDPEGNITSYDVNTLNQINQITLPSPFGYRKQFKYDYNNNLTEVNVENNDKDNQPNPNNPWLSTSYSYNILDKLTSKSKEIMEGVMLTTNYEYDDNDNLKRITEPLGNKVLNVYDEHDLAYQMTRGEGSGDASTVTYNYDWNENLETFIDGESHATTYAYDEFDRLTNIIDALGNEQINTYDKASNITQTKFEDAGDVRLAQTDFSHDELNRTYQKDEAFFNPVAQIDYAGSPRTTQYYYDLSSRLYKIIDENNNETILDYDNANRLKESVDELGNEVDYIYDDNSNIYQITETEISQLGSPSESFTTTFTYDEINRLRQTTNNDNKSRYYDYDSRNNLVYYTDAKGNTATHIYDALSRNIQTRYNLTDTGDGGGSSIGTITVSQAWDDNGRLVQQMDSNGNATTYTYDDLNRPFLTTFADFETIFYQYDGNDNVTSITDQNGTVSTNGYDAVNRLTSRAIVPAAGVGGIVAETYGYDGLSRTTLAQNDYSTVTFTYDSLGNLRSETQNGKTVTSNYEASGNRTQVDYPGGRSFDLAYDELNRINTINEGLDSIVDYSYFGPSRVERRDYLNGTRLTPSYDNIKRITQVLHERVGLETIADIQYGYDEENSRLYEKKNQLPWSGEGDVFVYDSVYRLKTGKLTVDDPIAESQTPGSGGTILTTINYSLDDVGNRTSIETNGSPVSYVPNIVNEYDSVGGISFTYDDNGNLKDNGTYKFVYDYRNQLIEVKDSVSEATIATYEYDALGRRIKKNVYSATLVKNIQGKSGLLRQDVYSPLSVTTTNYYYDGSRRIEDRDGSDTVQATYVYGNGIDEILQMKQPSEIYYFHENALGSITQVSYSIGAVHEKYDYDPFGKVTIRNAGDSIIPSSAISNPFMFTGREYDEETGLYYYRSRYYDPGIGRFLQRDPIGIWTDEMNLGNGYTYVANNPVNFVDPLGLWKIDLNKGEAVAEKGDSLWKLARQITGHGIDWESLDYKRDPGSLQIGEVINIRPLLDIKNKRDEEEARRKAEEERKRLERELPTAVARVKEELGRLESAVQKIEDKNLEAGWFVGGGYRVEDEYGAGNVWDVAWGIIQAWIRHGPTKRNERKWKIQERMHELLAELKRLEAMQKDIEKSKKKAKEKPQKKTPSFQSPEQGYDPFDTRFFPQ